MGIEMPHTMISSMTTVAIKTHNSDTTKHFFHWYCKDANCFSHNCIVEAMLCMPMTATLYSLLALL